MLSFSMTVLPCQLILWCSYRQCCATDTATLPVNPMVFLQAVLCNWQCCLASQSYGVPTGSVVQLTVLPCQSILWCSYRQCCATDSAALPGNPMVFLQAVLCNWHCYLARQSYGVPPGSVVQLTFWRDRLSSHCIGHTQYEVTLSFVLFGSSGKHCNLSFWTLCKLDNWIEF